MEYGHVSFCKVQEHRHLGSVLVSLNLYNKLHQHRNFGTLTPFLCTVPLMSLLASSRFLYGPLPLRSPLHPLEVLCRLSATNL